MVAAAEGRAHRQLQVHRRPLPKLVPAKLCAAMLLLLQAVQRLLPKSLRHSSSAHSQAARVQQQQQQLVRHQLLVVARQLLRLMLLCSWPLLHPHQPPLWQRLTHLPTLARLQLQPS